MAEAAYADLETPGQVPNEDIAWVPFLLLRRAAAGAFFGARGGYIGG